MRKSFMFYLSWETQLDVLSDKEHRRFINNLIKWHQNEDVELKSKSDKLVWNGILPALEVNNDKWNAKAESSRENGKLGGRPPKNLKTEQVSEEPKKPVNSKLLNVDSKWETVDSLKLNEDSQLDNGNSEQLMVENEMLNDNSIEKKVNTGESQGSYFKNKIEKLTTDITTLFPQYPFLIDMANPKGIIELKNHIDDKKELEVISSILKELASCKKSYFGSYE